MRRIVKGKRKGEGVRESLLSVLGEAHTKIGGTVHYQSLSGEINRGVGSIRGKKLHQKNR